MQRKNMAIVDRDQSMTVFILWIKLSIMQNKDKPHTH